MLIGRQTVLAAAALSLVVTANVSSSDVAVRNCRRV
jgi:hypothetical protein